LFNNPNFAPPQAPPPPIDESTLMTANEDLLAAIAAALEGGKQVLAQRDRQKDIVVKLVTQLAHYVEANCKNDMVVFLSSGFNAVPSTRTVTPPVNEAIRKIERGPLSGQMTIAVVRNLKAVSYIVRWAPATATGFPENWSSQPIAQVRRPTILSGLTPGTIYVFQVCPLTKGGYGDWSEVVTRVVS
jgi:hypothetical protein